MVKLSLLALVGCAGLTLAAPTKVARSATKTLDTRQGNPAAPFESALMTAAGIFESEAKSIASALETEGKLIASDVITDFEQGAAIFEEIAAQSTAAFLEGEALIYANVQQGIQSFTTAFNAFASAFSAGAATIQGGILQAEAAFVAFETEGFAAFAALEKAVNGFDPSQLESAFQNLINTFKGKGLSRV